MLLQGTTFQNLLIPAVVITMAICGTVIYQDKCHQHPVGCTLSRPVLNHRGGGGNRDTHPPRISGQPTHPEMAYPDVCVGGVGSTQPTQDPTQHKGKCLKKCAGTQPPTHPKMALPHGVGVGGVLGHPPTQKLARTTLPPPRVGHALRMGLTLRPCILKLCSARVA